MRRPLPLAFVLFASLAGGSTACAGSAAPAQPAAAASSAPRVENVHAQIIATHAEGTERELFERGERAILAQAWREAADCFEAVLGAGPSNEDTAMRATFDLAAAYEGLGLREKARDRYHEVASRWPQTITARTSLLRAAALHAYLEEWKELGDTAQSLLARGDIDKVDRMTGLGARALSRIEQGDVDGGNRDVQSGLDLVEELRFGAGGRLPWPAAQLKFALGEVRRLRSEKIQFVLPGPDGKVPDAQAVPPDFLPKLEARCQLLLDAQNAYADALRAQDAHWIAMAGFRVGEMYKNLHHDLMVIPPTLLTKTDKQKQIFYAIMHVRYRVLLEKGFEMMKRTIDLGDRQLDASAWVRRAQDAKGDIEKALDEEKAIIASFPFTEEEIQKALSILKDKAEKDRKRREAAMH